VTKKIKTVMRKHFVLIVLSLFSYKLNAQNTNIYPETGTLGIGTTSPITGIGAHVSKGDNSMIFFGPNASWGGHLYVGSGTNRVVPGTAQVISSNGNLHLDAGQTQNIYLGYFTPTSTYINPNGGNVGIGTANPADKLDINGNTKALRYYNTLLSGSNSRNSFQSFAFNSPGFVTGWIAADFGGSGSENRIVVGSGPNGTAVIGAHNNTLTAWANVIINPEADGNVGIGTTNPQEKLSVNGNIRAKQIKVETANWPDYVFAKNYTKMPLPELEQFIAKNKHLPEVPSAQQVAKEGIELGTNQATLLKKIEELTLYVIDQNKELKKQNEKISQLEKKLAERKRGKK